MRPLEQVYRSISERSVVEIERKRSRFIGIAAPVETAAGAEAEIARAEAEFPRATHYCYAYRAGLESTAVRMSDAGEPQGTAGRPILEVIERNGLVNVCVVVVRYFGGTLLGAAGLVRAYSAAAAEAVAKAKVVTYALHAVFEACFDYAGWPRAERALTAYGATFLDIAYGAGVEVRVAAPYERRAEFEEVVTHLAARNCRPKPVAERYLPKSPES